MEIFNLIASVCSVVGLFVSLFVASKIQKMSNSNNGNTGALQQQQVEGLGIQKTAQNHSILADNHSNATYNDYSGATIMGEMDELPLLTELYYPIHAVESDKYQEGISSDTCHMTVPPKSNTLCISVDFEKTVSKPDANRWIGYSIKSLPMRDWRSFIKENYILQFGYMATGNIKEMWIEITNLQGNKKVYKTKLQLFQKDLKFSLQLNKFTDNLSDWKSIDEICFVFFPEDCVGQKGLVFITDLSISKG